LYLWVVKDAAILAVTLLALHIVAYFQVNTCIYEVRPREGSTLGSPFQEIPQSNAFMTSLSLCLLVRRVCDIVAGIFGGIMFWGVEGIVFAPAMLVALNIAWSFWMTAMHPEPIEAPPATPVRTLEGVVQEAQSSTLSETVPLHVSG
jgi:hypothetical protein